MKALDRADIVGKKASDTRICICGHSMSAHSGTSSADRDAILLTGRALKTHCTPGRMNCPCSNARPVLLASDARKFMRKTAGPGMDHALGLGIAACRKADKTVEWLVDMECERCKTTEAKLAPVALSPGGLVTNEPGADNALLCASCRSELSA